MFCAECGNMIEDRANYCTKCGVQVNVQAATIARKMSKKSSIFGTGKSKAILLLIIIFVVTAWYRLFLSLPLLLLVFYVKRESKTAIVLAGLYSVFVTAVNIAVYVEGERDAQGIFDSSVMPIYTFLGLMIALLVYLARSFKDKVSTDPKHDKNG